MATLLVITMINQPLVNNIKLKCCNLGNAISYWSLLSLRSFEKLEPDMDRSSTTFLIVSFSNKDNTSTLSLIVIVNGRDLLFVQQRTESQHCHCFSMLCYTRDLQLIVVQQSTNTATLQLFIRLWYSHDVFQRRAERVHKTMLELYQS